MKTMPCGCRWDGSELRWCGRHREVGSLAVDIEGRSVVKAPSKTKLKAIISRLVGMKLGLHSCGEINAVLDATSILRKLTDDQEPEEPKVEKICQTCKYKHAGMDDWCCATCSASDPWLWKLQPEEPKVKSLWETAKRLESQNVSSYGQDAANLCAIVLRRHRALLKMLSVHVTGFGDAGFEQQAKTELAEIDQMLKGSE